MNEEEIMKQEKELKNKLPLSFPSKSVVLVAEIKNFYD